MKGPPLGLGGEDITWPDQVAPWGRKASSTRKLKPQISNRLGGRESHGVLDTGATISIVAKKILPCGSLKNTMTTAAIRMADGYVVHSCGDCEVEVPMGSRTIAYRFYVMHTPLSTLYWGLTSSCSTPRFNPLRCKRPTSSRWTTAMAGSPCHWSSLSTPRAT